jgi:GTP cyclohydrolase III
VRLVKQNDGSLLMFHRDLPHVSEAMNVILDNLISDIKVLKEELQHVHETAKADADSHAEASKDSTTSAQDTKEKEKEEGTEATHTNQDSIVDTMQAIQNGRTPMETFTLSAAASLQELVDFVEKVKSQYVGLLRYFGEHEAMASNDFFGTINKFITEFNAAIEQVEKEEKAKVRILLLLSLLLLLLVDLLLCQ